MKTKLLLAIAVWLPNVATMALQFESSETPDVKAFAVAVGLAQTGNGQKALLAFEEFMERYPESKLAARAHYNIGHLHRVLKQDSMAIQTFTAILAQEYNERDPNNLMEPYALYKHHSCRNLAEIFLDQKNYVKAEYYIRRFDKEFPYQHFCGNEWAAYDTYKATMYARAYEGQGQILKAVRVMISQIPESGLASNDQLISLLDQLLRNNYTHDQLRNEFINALTQLTISGKKDNRFAEVILFGESVKFYANHGNDKNNNTTEDYRKIVLSNKLFKEFAY